jgi:hypothetical protein
MPSHTRAALPALLLAAVIATTLSGCGQAPWLAASATVSPSAPTPKPTIESIVNELAAGSTERKLVAGDVSLTATYWSDLSMDKWTAEANKPVSFSLIGTLGTDDGQGVYLSRVSVVPAVNGPDGVLPTPATLTDSASVSPGYSVKSPYSYSQTFVLPPVDPAATSITLSFTYELLIQTTPTSTTFAKQTATDQLIIAIAR